MSNRRTSEGRCVRACTCIFSMRSAKTLASCAIRALQAAFSSATLLSRSRHVSNSVRAYRSTRDTSLPWPSLVRHSHLACPWGPTQITFIGAQSDRLKTLSPRLRPIWFFLPSSFSCRTGSNDSNWRSPTPTMPGLCGHIGWRPPCEETAFGTIARAEQQPGTSENTFDFTSKSPELPGLRLGFRDDG